MKCPNCSTTNGESNKYCRECGLRLAQRTADGPAAGAPKLDELALGEELFEVWQIFESGQMDTALKMAERFARDYPESASSHSLVALIYERIAQQELANGQREKWRELVKLAIEQYEIIIDLNPDSTADREKLASLRVKLADVYAPQPWQTKKLAGYVDEYWAKIKTIPVPVLAASGAFLLCLLIVLLATSGARRRPVQNIVRPAQSAHVPYSEAMNTPLTQPSTSAQAFAPGPSVGFTSGTPPKLNIPPPAPDSELNSGGQQADPNDYTDQVPPKRIDIPSAQLSIIPDLKPKPAPKKTKPAPSNNSPLPAPAPSATPKPAPAAASTQKPSGSESGNSLLAQAITLKYTEGLTDEAIATAQRAEDAFQADIAAGKNVESAKRGVQTAQKYLTLWKSSEGQSQ